MKRTSGPLLFVRVGGLRRLRIRCGSRGNRCIWDEFDVLMCCRAPERAFVCNGPLASPARASVCAHATCLRLLCAAYVRISITLRMFNLQKLSFGRALGEDAKPEPAGGLLLFALRRERS